MSYGNYADYLTGRRRANAGLLVSHWRDSSGTAFARYHCWGAAADLRRMLAPFEELINPAAPAVVMVKAAPMFAACHAGCAGHLLILGTDGRPIVAWDTDAGLHSLELLREVLSDDTFCAAMCDNAAPLANLNVLTPCA